MSSLSSVTTIDLPDAMASAGCRAVMDALNGRGNKRAMFVGGCVRNALLALPVADVDIATQLMPDQVMVALKKAGIRFVPTGVEHGTVTAISDGVPYEITSLRRDVETDGRRAVVSFTQDWCEDATRRDFTMNTLLADMDGHVYDPTGRGVSDLRKGRVVFVGDADLRIREDYLRLLRFFRFHALYGKGTPDAEALQACVRHAGSLKLLSKERVTQEFIKLILARKSPVILRLMRDAGIARFVISSKYSEILLNNLIQLQEKYKSPCAVTRLLMLASPAQLERVLVLSNKQKRMLHCLQVMIKKKIPTHCSETDFLLYHYGRDASAQGVMMRSVMGMGATVNARVMRLVLEGDIPVFPVKARDLIARGMVEGPAVGKALKSMENKWIRSGFNMTFEAFKL